MKHYALCLVNKITGDIEHMATGDLPLSDELVGTPDDAAVTHQLIRFEFDAEPNVGKTIFRARQALEEFEMIGATPEQRSSPDALVKAKPGKRRSSNIKKGNEHIPDFVG